LPKACACVPPGFHRQHQTAHRTQQELARRPVLDSRCKACGNSQKRSPVLGIPPVPSVAGDMVGLDEAERISSGGHAGHSAAPGP
jgi:hypothetical protein